MTEGGAGRAPLAGVRILAVEQFGAGPYGTLYLADLGAEVIKIEDVAAGGDVGRSIPPGQVGTDSLYFEAFNRGKRSLALDLKNADGRAVFRRLAAGADAVFNNLRGDLPATLGLTYDALQDVNPAIVCCSLSAYGREGPRATSPGYDALVQAEAGWAALTGEPDGPPTKSALSLVDYAAGLMAALGMMVALYDAQRTGRGRDVDTNLYDAALALYAYPATWHLSIGHTSGRVADSAHPSIVPFQFFQTADGHLAVACAKERFFQQLIPAIGLPDLARDARFATFDDRRLNRDALLAILGTRFRERTTAEWVADLRGRVPVAPVRTMAEALSLDELTARRLLAEYEHEVFGTVRGIGLPVTMSGFQPEYRPAPGLDADRAAVLAEAGFSPEEMAALARNGAFGPPQPAPAASTAAG